MFPSNVNKLELYPRRRATEFYFEPQPPEEFQSRQVEHAQDKLENKSDLTNYSQPEMGNTKRIVPARNSDMRMYRNSYFS